LELREATGTDLDQEVIGRIETVRALLQETVEAGTAGRGRERDPLAQLSEPERLLDEAQRRWLAPPVRVIRGLAVILFSLNRWLMHWIFNLKVQGLEHLPEYGPFVLTPNHLSYLDGPVTVRFGWVADPAALEREGKGEDLQQRIAEVLLVQASRQPRQILRSILTATNESKGASALWWLITRSLRSHSALRPT
jgi:hypothetical protein